MRIFPKILVVSRRSLQQGHDCSSSSLTSASSRTFAAGLTSLRRTTRSRSPARPSASWATTRVSLVFFVLYEYIRTFTHVHTRRAVRQDSFAIMCHYVNILCVHIHAYICIYIYICICIYMHIYIYEYMYMYIYVYIHIHTLCIYIHNAYIYTYN